MKLLIDADFLVALAKEDDGNHTKALVRARTLKEAMVFVTPFTIPEAATVLSYRVSHGAAKKFIEEVREKGFIEVVVSRDVVEGADGIFLAQKSKGISWIDCLNVAVVRIFRLDGILSFDAFYKKLGVRMF